MPAMTIRKNMAAVGLVLLILGNSLLGVRLVWPEHTLATFDLGDDHCLRVWTRHDSTAVAEPVLLRDTGIDHDRA
jgi:hypothetical protein